MRQHVKIAVALCSTAALSAPVNGAPGVRVGDAYVSSNSDQSRWTIGTQSVQMTFALDDGRFFVASCLNKTAKPAREYVDPKSATDLLSSRNPLFPDRYAEEQVWSKPVTSATTADPAADGLRLSVKKGEMIGFTAGRSGQGPVNWVTKLDYGDGEVHTSSDDASLAQGPVWFYYLQVGGAGFMEPLSSLEGDGEARARVPLVGSFYYPMWTRGVSANGRTLYSTDYEAVRVWQAPKDGTVSISGVAKASGEQKVDVKILRIHQRPNEPSPASAGEPRWQSEGAHAAKVTVGGRNAVQLDWAFSSRSNKELRMHFHVQAYPGTSILRHWIEMENTGPTSIKPDFLPQILTIGLRADEAQSFTHHWMVGGNNGDDQGMLKSAEITSSYHQRVGSHGQWTFTPWMAMERKDGNRDGWFAELDYTGCWCLSLDRAGEGPLKVTVALPELQFAEGIAPGKKVTLPRVSLGVFSGGLDDMGRRIYDWQYAYLWDYTHDWYSRMLYGAPIYSMNAGTASNQENFTGRLRQDIHCADNARKVGFEGLWDDAGWYAQPGWWNSNREGPDFAETVRYVSKSGMKWTVWFLNYPSMELMDTKIGSWGSFQWRTDGVASFSLENDRSLRDRAQEYLDKHPRASFHTCGGGGSYAHTFEVQRFADSNYFADGGGDQTNHYFSYIDTPDRWFDNLSVGQTDQGGNKGRRMLSMVPVWGAGSANGDTYDLASIADLYRYLLANGVAGKWSYVAHPIIKGDKDFQYFQRISRDRKRSIVIIKHKQDGEVTIYPRGLLADHPYLTEFARSRESGTRSGADLMANGITLRNPELGELIFLNLPNPPHSGKDKTPPAAPGRVFARGETNLGFPGIGIYWSPGSDNNWVSAYEVRRGDRVLDRVGTGTFYFDRSEGWDTATEYSVRTIDGDDNVSDWAKASLTVQDPPAYSALGGHSSQSGLNGWLAECATDDHGFAEMAWVPPGPLTPVWADIAKQAGGVEGYWESAATARVGRGWQRASTSAACIRTWIAPKAGKIRIIGRAIKDLYHQGKGGNLRIRILRNETQVWPSNGWADVPRDSSAGAAHDLTSQVSAGDKIRFVLDKGTTPENDYIAWMPKIAYLEPRAASPDLSVVRIFCGSDKDYTDANGNVWKSDRFHSGGAPVTSNVKVTGAAPTPGDQALYRLGRTGADFTYSVPVEPGIYSLRLKFAEQKRRLMFERPFNLSINGRQVLTNFDICKAAGGSGKAHEEVFRYLVSDSKAQIVLRFTGGWEPTQKTDEATVQAIEILPEIKPAIRIDAGSEEEFVDWSSSVWRNDRGFDGGVSVSSDSKISQASPTLYDQGLYSTARTGKSFRYTIPAPPGLYTVHLKFAELWLKEMGKRPMDVEINGRRVRDSWDPAKAAGEPGMAADFRIEDIAPNGDNKILIAISAAGANDAILQGIEIE